MKNRIAKQILLLHICVISLPFLMKAQTQELYKLTNGTIVESAYLLDQNEDVFGYFYLLDEGKVDDIKHLYRYVILDNNLTKIASNSYQHKMGDKWNESYNSIVKVGDSIFIHSTMTYSSNMRRSNSTQLRVIDLISNTISPTYVVQEDSLEKLISTKNLPEEFKYKDINDLLSTIPYKSSAAHLLFFGNGLEGTLSIKLYDDKYENIWSKSTAEINNNKATFINEFEVVEDMLILKVGHITSGAMRSATYILDYNIIALDIHTGDVLFNNSLGEMKNNIMHEIELSVVGNKVNIIGSYAEKRRTTIDRFNLMVKEGFFIRILTKNGEETATKYFPWSSFSPQLTFDKRNRMDKRYYLDYLDYLALEDGSSMIIAEKSTYEYFPQSKRERSDLVCIILDKNLNIEKVEVIEKGPSEATVSDYLFTEYSTNRLQAKFFFVNYKKANKKDETDQGWLAINKIGNGKITTEQIPMISDDYITFPIRAKKGYILFQEYDKKEGKSVLRLETLND